MFHPWTRRFQSSGDEYVFTMNLSSRVRLNRGITVMAECRRKGRIGLAWNLFLMEGGERHVGSMQMNILHTAIQLGAENWTILTPEEQPLLLLEREGDSVGKRLLDEASAILYNPQHSYVLKNPQGTVVARLSAQHKVFTHQYHFQVEGGSELEQQVALMAFALFTLMLKK